MANNFKDDIEKIVEAIEQLYNISIKKKQTMPDPSLDYENQIILYVGETNNTYVKNTFYRCENNGTNYVWIISNFNVTKADVGLGNVDNTADLNKPVSNLALEVLCPQTETTSLIVSDAIEHNAIDYTIYGDTVDDKGVGDEVTIEGQTKYIIPVSVRGKNLLDSSLLMNSENYTLNSWYNGVYKAIAIPVPNGTYVFSTKHLSGFIQSNMTLTVSNYINTNPGVPSGSIFEGDGQHGNKTITLTITEGYVYFSAYRRTASNLKEFYSNVQVMLEKGSAGTAYEPYVAPQTVNIYLDEPLGESQSISLADTNVTIPLISKDTNIIEFGTRIQPSSVKIKYYQNINKVIANLQALILNQVANLQALILSYHS